MNEDLKLAMKLERNRVLEAEIDSLKRENEELVRKFELAHKQIDKATAEAEKAKKAAINNTRKKLESTRDKLCAIAETSQNLRDLLPASNQTDSVHNSIMNILANIELVTEEMERLELWPATSPKPRTDRPKEEVKSTENPTLPFGEPEPEDEPEEKKELPSELEEVQGEVQELVAEPKQLWSPRETMSLKHHQLLRVNKATNHRTRMRSMTRGKTMSYGIDLVHPIA